MNLIDLPSASEIGARKSEFLIYKVHTVLYGGWLPDPVKRRGHRRTCSTESYVQRRHRQSAFPTDERREHCNKRFKIEVGCSVFESTKHPLSV